MSSVLARAGRGALRLAFGLCIALGMGQGSAQTFPTKPIALFHGFATGGSLDVVVRQVATSMGRELGQNVVVEAKPGATGTIAAATVARAPADGYTLLFGVAGNLAVAPAAMRSVGYDPVTSFTAISEVARGPYVLVVNADLPVKDVPQLCEYARAHPGKLNFGSSGPGSVQHFAGELLAKACGAPLQHVPYRGGGQSYPALITGEIHLMFDTMPGPQLFAQTGKVRPIAVTGNERLKSYPEVSTFREQGYGGVEVGFMYGVVAPAGTPAPVVSTLNQALRKALMSDEMKALLAQQDLRPSPSSPAAFQALIATEAGRWKDIVRSTGFKPE